MGWRKGGLFLFQILLSIWFAASIVFLLSRFLPSLYSAKGMADANSSVYGLANAEETNRVKTNYLQKMGLLLPKFYISLHLQGTVLASQTLPQHQFWVEKSVLWHGKIPTQTFYRHYLLYLHQNQRSRTKNLQNQLNVWALSTNSFKREKAARRFWVLLQKTGGKQVVLLLKDWRQLQAAASPAYYYFPSIIWHGTHNQYHVWLAGLGRGNLGVSLRDYRPVTAKIGEALVTSALIGGTGLVLALLISALFGFALVLHPLTPWTFTGRQMLYLIDSIPGFLLAILVLFIFLLSGGSFSYSLSPLSTGVFAQALQVVSQNSFVLSVLSLVLMLVPYLTLQVYQSLQHESTALYMRTARAKGLSTGKALRRHAIRNTLGPLLAILSEMVVGLMAGVLVLEMTFSLPGLGSLLTQSIVTADYPVVIGTTVFLLVFRIIIVRLSELALAYIDPRVQVT